MIDYMRKKIIIPLFDIREGNTRLKYLPIVRNELIKDKKIIEEIQSDKIKKLIQYAYVNVPYYKKLYDYCGVNIYCIDDLTDIPLITKDDIRGYNKEFLSREMDITSLMRTATGGTTDSPVTLFYSKDCFSEKQACTLYFFEWFDYRPGDKIAYLWGAEQDYPSKMSLRGKIVNYLSVNGLFLPISYLNDSIMFDYYSRLKKFKPKVLQSYPTPLYIFSCFLERSNLRLDIPSINVTAEFLYDYQREKIEEVFQCKVFNWYGARELGHIATECREHRGMHVNAHSLFVEVLKDGKRVYDEEGEVVVTDLLNKAMPLIRYKIGDLGKLSTRKCRCGSSLPILEDVGGRYVDSFKKRDGTLIPGVAFTNRVIKENKEIKELQIIQTGYERFTLNIVRGNQYSNTALEHLKASIERFMHEKIEFTVHFVDSIKRERSGKVRFCKCEIQ